MMALKRDLKFWALYFTGISSIIGSGWLFAPFYTAQIAGPLSAVSWLIGGVIMLIIAMNFAEVATMFPVAGGLVQTVQLSFGAAPGFILGWISWLSFVMIPAIETQAALQYSQYFFPHLVVVGSGGSQLTGLGYAWALVFLLVFFVCNSYGIRLVSKLNNVLAMWKIIIPLLTIIMLFITRLHWQNFHLAPQSLHQMTHTVLSGISLGGVVFSLVGFRSIVELSGEARQPQKTVPLALILTILSCTLLYLLLQVAFIGALNPQDIAAGWANLNFAHDSSPLLALVSTLGLIWLVGILYLDAVASPSGTGLITSASTARIVYGMAEQGYLPVKLKRLNQYQVPILALGLNLLLAILFFLPFHGWQAMAEFLATIAVVGYSFGPLCLYALRKQQPHRARKFKLPLAGLLSFMGFFCSNLIIYWMGWADIKKLLVLMIVLLVSILVMAVMKSWLRVALVQIIWLVVYIIGFGIIARLGSFGGSGVIGFGWDILSICVFSLLVS